MNGVENSGMKRVPLLTRNIGEPVPCFSPIFMDAPIVISSSSSSRNNSSSRSNDIGSNDNNNNIDCND